MTKTTPSDRHYPRESSRAASDPSFWTAAHGRAVDPSVLLRVLSRAAALGSSGVLVFDLDSTLLDNKPRQARIVREAGDSLGEPRLSQCQPDHFTDWSVDKPLRRVGILEHELEELVPKVRRYWKRRFFTSEYCVDDIAIAGAVDFVRQAQSLGTVIAAFDNEPIHINSYFEHFRDAQCVHMLTDDSARGIAPHPEIPSIVDFRRGGY